MSSFLTIQKAINKEKSEQLSKQAQKKRRKNQYSVDFEFGSNVDVTLLKEILVITQNIPQYVPEKIIFRLNSNIQFPIIVDSEQQLGFLNIDPHSYNYKVARYNKQNNYHIFNLEPIQREFTSLEKIKEILMKEEEQLFESFEQFHNKNTDISKYNVVTESKLIEFERSIQVPFTLYIQKNQNGIVTTSARIMNDAYLQMVGVNEEMLKDYVFKTGMIPYSFTGDGNYKWSQTLAQIFKSNASQAFGELTIVNYQGQKFPARLYSQNFHIFDQDDNSYSEYLYYFYDVEQRWMNQNQIDENCLDYFNRRSININEDTNEVEYQKRCKYRQL
ncbi:unnamed protein product (macronuclear) [Paramecium tetraurelia]|uniref:Chromosome undetermined scaffold_1, whole genome shotgun sequence n=1 Tax=Paramecium tetraurelia TaxID=5888 RepID=Q6BFW4_PARTE|nr:hypothetical protein [Paramecium tetraurelia strain d4-2]XP_001423220.1 uncharacterized protein GSPATT00000257001 [Paramecium tetraurelia]CAH03456.1 hypothetical protein PTMB.258 [Paramecium tetraurelia]CAK55822.1 unnamed protein product [Paramecium tetraurelia]|eukprot:XP_001423220.1 hypothetical protein (macronuclear) [Paramecium tetraurelia strain d4-2]